ncbi:bromodomain-containing protein 4 [Kryptolebias marmoratus]|uniref:bromodomain-containing protein 4 n=1 Tax=Kryptolebias marmoratus TaxID=37003 RepID=UPI0007F8A951|nr:bromodomain-containing protein 4 [Kryptolebias marmoratus]
MAEAIGFLLRLLLFSLLAARGNQAIAARTGPAEKTKNEDILVAGSEAESTGYDAGDDSLWVTGPPEDSTLEPNETSSYSFTSNVLPEDETLKQNGSILKGQNSSGRSQHASADNSGKLLQNPRSCVPTGPHKPPCPTQESQQPPCPPREPQQPTCPPQGSTQVPDSLLVQLSQLLKLLKQLNYIPGVPEDVDEQQPPHGLLPKWLQDVKQHAYMSKWLFNPQQQGYLPKWVPVPHQHHSYPLHKPWHHDYNVQESRHQNARVPQHYNPEPQSQGYNSREFRESHSYLPWEFWEPQPHGYPSRKPQPQPHDYLHRESQRQTHGYPPQDPMAPQMPQHGKPGVKPQVHRTSRFMSRWTDHLPQRPHYVAMRPHYPANRPYYKTRQPANSPQMIYYSTK